MRFYLALFLLISTLPVKGQVNAKYIDPMKLPQSVKYNGKVVDTRTWTDTLGTNYLVLTETGEFTGKNQKSDYTDCEGRCQDGELYAYHYIVKKDSTKVLWKITDFIRTCPYVVFVNFAHNALQVTDLDNDKIAETWIVYKIACINDTAPQTMKLIMHEGKDKFAIRGTDQEGEGKNIDDNFKKLSKNFLDFAEKLWEKFEIKY